MQWLASISVRRPVFATVMILTIVVVGIVGYSEAERRPLPQRRLPDHLRSSPCCRAPRPRRWRPSSPTRSRRRSTPSAASRSCARSPRRASPRSFVTLPLDKDINVAAQEVRDHVSHRAARSARGHEEPGHQQAGSRRGARAVHRAGVDAADPRADRARRPRGAAGAGEHRRRRSGDDRRRPQATDPGAASIRRGCARRGSPPSTCSGRSSRRTSATPGGSRRHRARSASPSASRGASERRGHRARSSCVHVDGHPILVRDVGQVDRRRGGGRDGRQHRRQAGGRAVDPQAVGRRTASRSSTPCGPACRRWQPTLPGGHKLNVIRDNTETHAHQRRRRAAST